MNEPRTRSTVPDDTRQDDALDGKHVEERLHVCIDALKCLQRLARLAEQPNNIPQLSSLFPFARMANRFARAIEGHLKAVTLVLPVTATNLPAPDNRSTYDPAHRSLTCAPRFELPLG